MNLDPTGSPRHEQTVAVALNVIIAQHLVQQPENRNRPIDSNHASGRNHGGPGRSRTADQRFRKPLLYPTELRGRSVASLSHAGLLGWPLRESSKSNVPPHAVAVTLLRRRP